MIPIVVVVLVSRTILECHLRLSPLGLLQESFSNGGRGHTICLDPGVKVFFEFHLQIVFRGIDDCLILFIKIIFTGLLLFFKVLLPSTLSRCRLRVRRGVLTGCRCVLSIPTDTCSKGGTSTVDSLVRCCVSAEASGGSTRGFSTCSLGAVPNGCGDRRVALCNIRPSDGCVHTSLSKRNICVSDTCTSGFQVGRNSAVALGRGCRGSRCSFGMSKVCSCTTDLYMFVRESGLGRTFSLRSSCFKKCFSSARVQSVPSGCVNSIVSLRTLAGVSERLSISVKSVVKVVCKFSIVVFLIIVCLLSGIVVRGGTRSVSVAGVLNCAGNRVDHLCVLSASLIIIFYLLLDLPIRQRVVRILFHRVVLSDVSK